MQTKDGGEEERWVLVWFFLYLDICESGAQSNELTGGDTELVQHFCLQGEFTSAHERCWTQNLI
jgi:hypothetical protein